MILCSLLHRGQTLNRKEEIMATLRSTRAIWMRSSSVSREAKKAAETVNLVLAKAGDLRDYGIDLAAERTSGAIMGQDMSNNADGSRVGLAFDGQAMLQSPMDFHERKFGEPH